MAVANSFITTDWLSMDMLLLLTNPLEVCQFMNTDYANDYQREFAPGEVVRIEYPAKFTVTNGLGYNPQSITRINTSVTVNQIFGVHFEWNDVEAALKLERGDSRITTQYVKGPLAQMAQDIDSRAALFATLYSNNIVGTLGTNPTTFQSYSNAARQRLTEMACPATGKRGLLVAPAINTALAAPAAGTVAQFNPTDEIAKQYKKGYVGEQGGFSWYESMSLYNYTAGTAVTALTISATAGQSGSSLTVIGTANQVLNVGDVLGIDSVYNVNPMTRQRTNSTYTKTVTVTQAITLTGGTDTIQITPPIYGPGSQYQNVDALPAALAALTLFPGTTSPSGKSGTNSLALHRDAFAMVAVPLELPKPSSQEIARQQRDDETGVAVRFVRSWDPLQSRRINRFDALMGFGILYNDNCSVRCLGA